MFRRKPEQIESIIAHAMNDNGLETPYMQWRLIKVWDDVVGPLVARNTQEKYIRNQTLFVKIISPVLRTEIAMRQSSLVEKLNQAAGAFVIADIKVF